MSFLSEQRLQGLMEQAIRWKRGEVTDKIIAEDVLSLLYEIRDLRHLLAEKFGVDFERQNGRRELATRMAEETRDLDVGKETLTSEEFANFAGQIGESTACATWDMVHKYVPKKLRGLALRFWQQAAENELTQLQSKWEEDEEIK